MNASRPGRWTGAAAMAAFASSIDMPDEVVAAARLLLLDTLGCAIAAHGSGTLAGASDVAADQGGRGDSTIIGSRRRVPASSAALANGVLSHALDYDDIHPRSSAHSSTVICPAALAVAEATGADGARLLRAIAIGTELTARIGEVVPAGFHERGFHVTSIAGVFGATAAAAHLRGDAAQTTIDALGLAGSMACGIFAYLDDGVPTKPLHAGWAAHSAVMAVELAAAGLQGPPSVLEARYGIFDTFLAGTFTDPQARVDAVRAALADLGQRWRTLEVTPKLYPSCYFMHPWLSAAQQLLSTHGVDGGRIESIHVDVPAEVATRLINPLERTARPESDYAAKFSLPYSLAAIAVHGRLDLASFTVDALSDPAVTDLATRMTVTEFDQHDWASAPRGRVVVRTSDGTELAANLSGTEFGTPASAGEGLVIGKFMSNAARAVAPDRAAALRDAVLGLGGSTPASALTDLLGDLPGPASQSEAPRYGHVPAYDIAIHDHTPERTP